MLSSQREICEMAAVKPNKSARKSPVKCKSKHSLLEAEQSLIAAVDDVISKNICMTEEEQNRYRKRFTEVTTNVTYFR